MNIEDKLVRISVPILAPLAPSQETTADQLAAFYRPSAIPFTRHSPLPVVAQSASGAVAKSSSQLLATRAVYGITRNVNQIPVSVTNQGLPPAAPVTTVARNMPSTYTLTGSWTNPQNAIDNDPTTYASASSTTANVVYLASVFSSLTSTVIANTLQVILWVTAVSGGNVVAEYSIDGGNNWTNLASVSVAQAMPQTYTANLPLTIAAQNVQVRITLPGSSSGNATNASAYAGTGANDAAVGTAAWVNPTNAEGNQTTSYASVNLSASSNTSEATEYLKLTNFGFAIPAGATINGIGVSIYKWGATYSGYHLGSYWSTSVLDNSVKLYKAGSIIGSEHAASSAWPNSPAGRSYGGSADLWGTSWGVSDINNSGFGIGISANLAIVSSGFQVATYSYVYNAAITVYYTTSSGSSSATAQLYDIAQLMTLHQ
jgi:hypothetical protein